MIISKRFKKTFSYLIIAFALFYNQSFQMFAYLGSALGLNWSVFASSAVYILFYLLFAGWIANVLNCRKINVNFRLMLILTFLALAFIYTNNAFPDNFNVQYQFDIYKLIFLYFPTLVVASSIDDYQDFLIFLNPYNICISLATYYIFLRTINNSSSDEDMTIAYMLCICAIFSLFYAKSKINKKINIALAIVDCLLMLGAGTRGAFLCVAAYFIVMLVQYFFKKPISPRKFLVFFATIILLSLCLLFINPILIMASDLLSSLGLSTRILDSALNGSLSDSYGRTYIQSMIISGLNRMPFLGYGLLGDGFITNGMYYAHNFELELLIDFGWLIGSSIIAGIIFLIVFSLRDRKKREFGLIMICYTFLHLQVSLSYLIDFSFWVMLGFLISISYSKNDVVKTIFFKRSIYNAKNSCSRCNLQ